MQGPALTDISDRNKTPNGRRGVVWNYPTHSLCLPIQLEYLPSLSSLLPGSVRDRQEEAAYLRMVDTQGLDLVKGQQDTDKEHLVLFLEGQGEAVDDARVEGGLLGPGSLVQVQGTNPPNSFQACVAHPLSPAQDLQELGNPVVMLRLIDEPEGRIKGLLTT